MEKPVRAVLKPLVSSVSVLVLSIVVLKDRSEFLKLGLIIENLPLIWLSESVKLVASLIPLPK